MRRPLRLTAVSLLAFAAGCSPTFWRQQADRDAYRAISRTIDDPRIQLARFDVTPDPSSRFFDPHAPDCQPLPPDDPTAHQYMNAVGDWQGYNGWHKAGQSLVIENPQWYANLGLDSDSFDVENGRYTGGGSLPKLRLDQAVELALIHGRSYQQQIEDVFLAALDVAGEEFQFGVRYLNEPNYNLTTSVRPGGDNVNGADLTSQGASFGLSRLLPSGAQLTVSLANSTLWLLQGDGTTSFSTLSYDLTQPLFAAGGRKINLENLTQSQRDLLYELRDLARFRREYFTDVVATQAGGYLGLLQQVQTIRNQVGNIERLQRQLDVLRAQASQKPSRPRATLLKLPQELGTPDKLNVPTAIAGDLEYDTFNSELVWSSSEISDDAIDTLLGLSDDPAYRVAVEEIIRQLTANVVTLDVLQLESTLANSINGLRSQERRLQDSLDSYKIFLGLPTDFPLGIDDALLEPFQFIDARLTQLDKDIESDVRRWAMLDEDDPDPAQLAEYVAGIETLLARVEQDGVSIVTADLERVKNLPMERLDEQSRRRLKADGLRDRQQFSTIQDRLEQRRDELQIIRERLALATDLAQAAAASGDPLAAASLQNQAVTIRQTARNNINITRLQLLQDAQSLAVIQIGVRSDVITVEPVDLSIEDAVLVGLENRLDLMNARAEVTDAWRRVEIAKQLLRSNLNLTADGTISGPRDERPFDFDNDFSQHRFGLSFDTPLDQINERNTYRAAQIAYQQARRAYMLAEDSVKLDIRRSWRQIQVLTQNLETAKRAVRIAALQYDVAAIQANAPASASGGSQGAGVRGRNLLNALQDVLGSQNDLIGIFVSYETNRLALARDMGVMTIGNDGVWEDPVYRRVVSGGSFLPTEQADGESTLNGEAEAIPAELPDVGGVSLPVPVLEPISYEKTQSSSATSVSGDSDWSRWSGFQSSENPKNFDVVEPLFGDGSTATDKIRNGSGSHVEPSMTANPVLNLNPDDPPPPPSAYPTP